MSDTPPVVSDTDATCQVCDWFQIPDDGMSPPPHTLHDHYVVAHKLEPTP